MQRNGGRQVGALRSAFTLIELLVTIAIIAVLASVVAPSIFQNVSDAKVNAAKSQIGIFSLALDGFRIDNDVYPTSEQGLEALRTLPDKDPQPGNWRGPYLRQAPPFDPWRRPYVFVSPGVVNNGSYDLYTLGRDGKIGGEGEDTDITSWGGKIVP